MDLFNYIEKTKSVLDISIHFSLYGNYLFLFFIPIKLFIY